LEPGLYVVATPIGNLRDITLRALDTLAAADLILAEDTRTARKLLSAHGLTGKLSAYHDHNADHARPQALTALDQGQRVALISEAGTPLVSDPGFKLVRAAIAEGHKVIPIPGASAPLAALVAAGLPTDRFLFAGFLPSKPGPRRAALKALAGAPATLIFFESGPRLAASLADMVAVLGSRPAAVARELTKLYEEFRRRPLDDLAAAAAAGDPPRGEIVVLVGPGAEAPLDAQSIDEALLAALDMGSLKEAVAQVAAAFGASRAAVYARALALKNK
jgi:16S rRNA (cytidine1402-2'-O)-methyltransferase